MSTFHARSATEALFPWSLIWISEDTAANSLKIVRLKALNSFPNVSACGRPRKYLKTGRTVHHLLRMTHRECVWKLKLDRLKSLEVQIEIKF